MTTFVNDPDVGLLLTDRYQVGDFKPQPIHRSARTVVHSVLPYPKHPPNPEQELTLFLAPVCYRCHINTACPQTCSDTGENNCRSPPSNLPSHNVVLKGPRNYVWGVQAVKIGTLATNGPNVTTLSCRTTMHLSIVNRLYESLPSLTTMSHSVADVPPDLSESQLLVAAARLLAKYSGWVCES